MPRALMFMVHQFGSAAVSMLVSSPSTRKIAIVEATPDVVMCTAER